MKNLCLLVLGLFFTTGILSAQTFKGTASFYHPKFVGRPTATGEIFSNSKLTCACNRLPLNTTIKVTNLSNGKSVVVRVNDRLAASNNRLVDLSQAAARQLDFMNSGLTKVSIEVISKPSRKQAKSSKKALEKTKAVTRELNLQ